ncbi:hypothetical protein GGR56DRAFT_520277 [Xylariaceae sp. FL0804]|nr:hypothetical protein GGR56DRAFT_520277 [Xylariaceae sp. FL0804]
MSLRQLAAVALLAVMPLAVKGDTTTSSSGLEQPSTAPTLGTDTVHGCYSDVTGLTNEGALNFNSQGKCAQLCRDKNMAVGATFAKNCYCGDSYPNSKYLVDDSKCNEPCPGYDTQACGGLNTWTVYNTGVQVAVGEMAIVSSSSSSSSSTTTTGSEATNQVETVTASAQADTSASSSSDSDKSSSGGSNTTGIAVGVVVAIVVVGAIGGGLFFWQRRKRNSELSEEGRRNAAVNAFISGGKPPGSSGGLSMADSRMDPIMNRRLSDGSIADNQDYSRRILRVTNA